ncbi:MAG: family 78 glycoside hydrolase catalytic domain [Paludibacteraceae bacterium]|nr:family 78 glycoside hydrolase catalytic domain [Paludibacteraceae bacterium]
MKKILIFNCSLLIILASCSTRNTLTPDATVGTRVQALPDSLWAHASWLSAANAPVVTDTVYDGTRAADGASWFVACLTNTKPVQQALWMTSALGVYDLFINTQRVGTDLLKPGFTHYAKTRRSFTYDITEAFRRAAEDTNTLSAQVTPGWWADKIITPAGTPGMYGRKPAFRSVLLLTYTDGSTEILGTDTLAWRAGIAGPVTHAAVFDGEEYDARIPMGWDTPQKLTLPELNHEFSGDILPSEGAEVCLRYDLALPPVHAYVYKEVELAGSDRYGRVVIDRTYRDGSRMKIHKGETLVLDFGQNCAAVPHFVFAADEGTTLTFAGGELLNDSLGARSRGMDGPEGAVHRENLRIPDTGATLRYTFGAANTPVNYHPHHTFFGYRYAELTADADVTVYSVRSIPVSSLTAELETGSLTTGSSLVNRLILNTLWGQRSNYLSVPTDCPQRNERLGWTADTQVFAETGTFFADTDAFFRKWLRDLRDTQKENGGFPGVAPWGQYGSSPVDMARVGWSDAGVIVPWVMMKQFADSALVNEHWTAMERYVDHIAAYQYDHTAMFPDNGGYQWADWLSYEALESFTGQPWDARGLRPEAAEYWSYLGASYWLMDSRMMLDMARFTGRDTLKYSEMSAKARAYLQDRFLLPDGSFRLDILNTMQTPAVFALYNGLLSGEAKERMIARLRDNFLAHGQCLQTGFLGTSILMPTLSANGMTDVAYDLLFQRKNPSWLYSVDNGATTIWERWNSYTIERGMAPNGMNSFNHYAYGCVCQWLWQTAAGIQADPKQPGFKHIILNPVPDKRLGSIDASYQSAAGLIRSEWHYQGDSCLWTFTIPEGTTATVFGENYLPGTYSICLN